MNKKAMGMGMMGGGLTMYIGIGIIIGILIATYLSNHGILDLSILPI
ncbi:hypothetical protein HN924_03710 [Candidatus Woesearchaeota archaeon]|jgi:hypothetical protein|nr:hypothetical protein [Candidatus Woesearchaeota archaeon]MBT7063045.1 hypothetical protein [Candidatus Woesearchaeota archaeon]MBT7402480.1 hypothetical protein [Candidatus Woesearchaeota archaeon]